MKSNWTGPEAKLQIAVIDLLAKTGVPGLLYHSISNEGQRSPQRGAMLKRMGLLPGVADLFVKRKGLWPLYLELKRPGQVPRPEQAAFARLARDAECFYEWTDNLDGAIQILDAYGALRLASFPLSRK